VIPESKDSTPLVPKPWVWHNQFHPPPILTACLPKIQLSAIFQSHAWSSKCTFSRGFPTHMQTLSPHLVKILNLYFKCFSACWNVTKYKEELLFIFCIVVAFSVCWISLFSSLFYFYLWSLWKIMLILSCISEVREKCGVIELNCTPCTMFLKRLHNQP
jgi:hypothetical protein